MMMVMMMTTTMMMIMMIIIIIITTTIRTKCALLEIILLVLRCAGLNVSCNSRLVFYLWYYAFKTRVLC